MTVIEVENVSKTYPPHPGARMLLGRGGLGTLLGRGRGAEGVTALHDINLSIEAGECVGIIGANGSGKTTLLKLLSGITAPSSGRVSVYARAVSLIELGAGFHDLLSGRENVYMNGLLLGMSKREVDAVMESILEFADIGEAIEQPVGAYSSGMKLRLAFATAVHADPDIFLLDEVLAVGDEAFQRKCREKMAELRDAGKTFVYISHDLISVSAMCDRCYLLQKGELIDHGDVESTIDFYVRQSVGATSHTLSMQGTDVVFRDGRLSIFKDGNEITAPVGCQTNLMHHAQWRYATFAAWRILESEDTRLVVEGRMPVLPVSIRWTLDLDAERLRWNVAMLCDRDVAIEEFETNVYLPASYRRWRYESQDEAFPDIREADLACELLAGPEISGRHAAALDHSDGLPAVTLEMDTPMPSMRLRVQNSDHALGCRILQAWTRLPLGQGRLEKGEYDLVTLTLGFDESDEAVSERFDAMARS